MDAARDTKGLERRDRLFSIAIPAFAFGGILIAIVSQGLPYADTGSLGCITASFLLGIFAYLKPKKDIVAICTPIYGIVLFVLPGDMPHSLLLQVLFAVSITILLVRLNNGFGSLADIPRGDTMEKFLHDYIERIRPKVPGIPEKTAHRIASAFLSFKFGLFTNAGEECTLALPSIPEGEAAAALRKALQIVKINASDLENSQVTADSAIAFSPEEKAYVAVVIPDERNEDPASLELDNALILLYSVALITSPDDEQALEEHRNYIIRILTSYKSALGIT